MVVPLQRGVASVCRKQSMREEVEEYGGIELLTINRCHPVCSVLSGKVTNWGENTRYLVACTRRGRNSIVDYTLWSRLNGTKVCAHTNYLLVSEIRRFAFINGNRWVNWWSGARKYSRFLNWTTGRDHAKRNHVQWCDGSKGTTKRANLMLVDIFAWIYLHAVPS